MPYQPQKLIERYIHGCTLLRPIPTNPSSLMCKLGLHNLSEFDTSKVGRSWQKCGEPTYCTRCYHSNWGALMPTCPKPPVNKGQSLLSKAAEIARELQKLDDLKGYMESREIQLRKELDEIIGNPDYPTPPKAPVPPGPRIIRENGIPTPPVPPSGIRKVKDGIPKAPGAE
ncbi:hypothetical protein VPHK120G1_0007 [Vibrio phage K120 g1]